ncbi:transposase [Aliiroseovarius crassostreae]|uniref:transposase n=1 Tax=Aliiroseovarius crassostreae TaxID=154981 RepID=UPI000B31CA1E
MFADKAYDEGNDLGAGCNQRDPVQIKPQAAQGIRAGLYKERNKIERFFGRLKVSFRGVATRYAKTSRNFMAMIKLASVRR